MTKTKSIDKTTEQYLLHFEKLMKCSRTDFDFKPDDFGILIKHHNEVYRVASESDVSNHCIDIISDPEFAWTFIPLPVIIEIAEGIHLEYEFFRQLPITSDESATYIRALEISNLFGGEAETFWMEVDEKDPALCGKMMSAIFRYWDRHSCLMELEEALIEMKIFCAFEEGVHEYVCMDDSGDSEDPGYWVFQVDDIGDFNRTQKRKNRSR